MSTSSDNALSDESVMDYTQRLRMRVVTKLLGESDSPPSDPKEVLTLNTVLDSMDRTALGSLRAKREAQVDDMSKQAAALVHEVLQRAGNVDIFAVGVISTQPRQVQEIPPEMADPVIVPGELEVGLSTMTSDAFLAEYEARKAASGVVQPED